MQKCLTKGERYGNITELSAMRLSKILENKLEKS